MFSRKTRRMDPSISARRPCAAAILALSASLVVAVYFAPSPAAAGTLGGRARLGQAIFQQRCITCHNKQPGDTSPFGPPNLNGIFRGPSPLTTKQATNIIENGKSTMPAFGSVLTRSDVDNLIAYLRTR